MSASHENPPTVYLYDPLDRLVSAHSTLRFYNGVRIATEIQGERKTCFFEQMSLPLAELQLPDTVTLLATDQQKTVLHCTRSVIGQPQFYSPYGHCSPKSWILSSMGFNGERVDSVTGHYMLGQGYRAYNPVLMRFNSPDNMSPFGKGGPNAYAYCDNDPVNLSDSTGHFPNLWKGLKNLLHLRQKRYLAAFHGSSSGQIESLINGLKKEFQGTNRGQNDGPGFYSSTLLENTESYARGRALREYKGPKINDELTVFYPNLRSSDFIKRNTPAYPSESLPAYFGVYVKNYPKKRPGLDFKVVRRVREFTLIFPDSMYPDIKIKHFKTTGKFPKAHTKLLEKHGISTELYMIRDDV